MTPFSFYNPVKVVFGRGTVAQVGAETAPYGRKALLVYGQASLKRAGLYDRIVASLNQAGVEVVAFGGVQANPLLSHARQGIALAKAEGCDVVVAAGGGSVLDTAKGIAGGAGCGIDPWDVLYGCKPFTAALPLVTVLTVPAAGSEMNAGFVLTDDVESGIKGGGFGGDPAFPKVSILDPETTLSVSPGYMTYACADVMSHLVEKYFTATAKWTPVQDRMIEGLVLSAMECLAAIHADPVALAPREAFMWNATLAWNGLPPCGLGGSTPAHLIEHGLSAVFPQIAHGQGLALIQPTWLRWFALRTPVRPARFARAVFGVDIACDTLAAVEGARRYLGFMARFGGPCDWAACGVREADLAAVARSASQLAQVWGMAAEYPEALILEILKMALPV
jgi:alcohol dehydrogenase YqhD (iron-dependent ADH family)